MKTGADNRSAQTDHLKRIQPHKIQLEQVYFAFFLRFAGSEDCLKIFHFPFTTVFVDTRLSRTKHPRKRFQNFRQSYTLSPDRVEIHQSQLAWRKEDLKVTPVAVIGGFQSDLSITCMIDGSFGNVSAGVLFSKVAYQLLLIARQLIRLSLVSVQTLRSWNPWIWKYCAWFGKANELLSCFFTSTTIKLS